jgi:prophage regulatory protein
VDVDVEETKAKPKRLIRRPVVIDRTGLQTSQIYDLIGEKRFPAPVPIGARAVAWVESEIEQWIDARIRERESIKSMPRSVSIKRPRNGS